MVKSCYMTSMFLTQSGAADPIDRCKRKAACVLAASNGAVFVSACCGVAGSAALAVPLAMCSIPICAALTLFIRR
jgi:hypothetical protein